MTQQLQMIWPGRPARVPKEFVPDGYALRHLRDGDESSHVRVMRMAGFADWNEEELAAWRRKIALPDGFYVAVHAGSGEIAATALAAHRPTGLHPSGGELGWVAADPAHAGRGLGMAVCIAVLRRFMRAGYRRIYLSTDDHRLSAIKTYLKIGFVPFVFADDMERRWQAVAGKLAWRLEPGKLARAPRDLWARDGKGERPDSDRMERYAVRRKWLPRREHRGYACDGDMDAFGDESLYKPSRLGFAAVSPGGVEAGARAPLAVSFTAGRAGVAENTVVRFVMRGQSPLGRLPDCDIEYPGRCKLEKLRFGFRVARGSLAPGEQVNLKWPSFQWTPLAGRREFKVVFSYGGGRPEERLPEPLVIRVEPKAIRRLEATMACTYLPDTPVGVQVTARDEYDNRTPYTGDAAASAGRAAVGFGIVGGFGAVRLPAASRGVIRVSVESPAGSCVSNPSVPAQDRRLFIGDLHCHDFLSEAEGYSDEVYRWAIEDRGLDFISVVPQSHGWHDNETWTIAKYMNERFLEEGRFVTFLGFEWQHTGYGDKVIHFLGGDQPYLPVDDPRYRSAAGLYAALRGSDALAIGHHPCYPPGSWCSSTDFDAVETDVERLVELWSMHGSSEGYDPSDRPFAKHDPDRLVMAALKRGLRLGFTGGSDTHSGRPGGSAREPLPYWGGLTAVWAERLSRRDIFRALLARRTYALTRARIVLRFTVNGLPMGSETGLSDEADIRIDAWSPGLMAKVEVMKNACLLKTFRQSGDECHIRMADRTGGAAYYHCRVTLADGNLAVCSPVWLG